MADDASARRLASIVAVDMAGYSRRTETDEAAAIGAVTALKARVTAAVLAHGGRVFNTAGDGFMLEFPAASSALEAAEQIAGTVGAPVRVGVHLGDVSVTESGDLLGHGVNVAARIQQMAQPGAVLASADVKHAIRGPLGERLKPQGSVRLDKMSEVITVFALAPLEGGRPRGRRRDLLMRRAPAAAVLLALLSGGAGIWLAHGRLPWARPEPVRIAITPFEASESDPALRQLADGITDRTVAVLTANQVQTTQSRGQAAGSAGTRFMLAGSIRRDDRTLQVSAKVEDARDHVVLWSGQLARRSGEAPALQLQASAWLANVLKCAAEAEQDPNAPKDAQTLSLYLQFCDSDFSLNDLGQIEQVISLLRQLETRAPRFSSAHADLAYISAFTSDFFPPGQRAELRRTAQAEAEKAISLDPKSAEAYVVLSVLAPVHRWADREALLSRAVSLDPNSGVANLWYGSYLTEVGRLRDALVYLQKAAALDPLGDMNGSNAALGLAALGQTIAADATLQRVLNDWPGGVAANGAQFYIARWESRFDDALSMVQKDGALNTELNDAERKAWQDVLPALSSRDLKRMAAERKSQIAFAGQSPIDLSFAIENLSQLGLIDDAFALADRLRWIEIPINSGVLFDPPTAPLRRDRRFIALAAKLGLVDYWRSTGQWPDFCAEPGLPYDCKAEAAKLTGARHG